MIEIIRKWINRNIIYRNAELTPKGECFKNYCKQIENNTLENKISSYEEFIEYIRCKIAEECGMTFDREETAEFILMTYEEIL